jgi:PKHD-type hydroxylase
MDLTNTYWWWNKAISQENCERIIKLGTEKIEKLKLENQSTSAITQGRTHKQGLPNAKPMADLTIEEIKLKNPDQENVKENNYIRDSEVCWLNEPWMYEMILPFIHQANENAGWKYEIDQCEDFQFTVYQPGGFYGWHTDSGSDHFSAYKKYIPEVSPVGEDGLMIDHYTPNDNWVGKIRKISMTINLNFPGEYEGGNLKIDFGPHSPNRYHEVIEIRPQGSMIVFPSYIHHQVTPITRGTRCSLVLWCLGKPFK